MNIRLWSLAAVVAMGVVTLAAYNRTRTHASMTTPNGHILFNGWGLSPVGDQLRVGDMPLKLIASPDGKQLITVSQGFSGVHLTTVDVATRAVIQTADLDRTWNGLAFSPDGKTLYVGGGNGAKLTAFSYSDGHVTKANEVKAPESSFISGVAVNPTSGNVYVLNEAFNQVYVLQPGTLKVLAFVNTGSNPHSCVFGADGRHLYISNWGGESVTVIDTATNSHIRDVRVGVRPNDMALAPDGRLFVACAGDNTIHVIQTRGREEAGDATTRANKPSEVVREILNTSIEPTVLEGSTPDGVAVTPDGKTLYVANADNNNVMVADISDPKATAIRGFIPTGWYPTAVATVADQLFVAVGKGLQSRPNFPAQRPEPETGRQGQKFDYTGNCFEGYISFLPKFSDAQLASWTKSAVANSPFHLAQIRTAIKHGDSVVPDTVGKGSPIDHVLYVIMENRTYDQVFGDLSEGNGDPRICMYGEKITPNRHKLAREYTLLDNLYCNSEVSVDGHSWCDSAMANDANQREWTSSYSDHGDIINADEVMEPTGGFLWDAARRAGLSVKAYGEGDNDYLGHHALPVDCRGTWHGNRDMDRVDGWIHDLHEGERNGKLANLMIMSLGEDHTAGTTPGRFTPEAAVGSNDQAIGKIIAAASRSKYWKSMAIFFVEDDAQNGPDHVDAHRTFGLVVSPWVKRHAVDHTMYSQVSMVRTIELLLGLPPLTQYDAAATPMYGVFGSRASASPYDLAPALTDLLAKNTPKSPGAEQSLKMNLDEYDRAPEGDLNRILWAEAKGPNVPYPTTRTSFR